MSETTTDIAHTAESPIYQAYKAQKDLIDALIVVSTAYAAAKMGPEFNKVFSIREKRSPGGLSV